MKKLMFLIACMLLTLSGHAQFSGSGSGTTADPFLIFNVNQLNQVRNYLNQTGIYFKLMSDIDVTSFINDDNPTQGWLPTGVSGSPFKGIFDGNSKTISGLFINRSGTQYVGFFGNISGATIKDLTLKGTTVTGGNYTGFLTGYAENSTITNVTTEGSVVGSIWAGGVIGNMSSTTLSTVSATGNVSGGNYSGGIAGQATSSSTISNANIKGNVTGSDYTGGIVGKAVGSSIITKTTITGAISGSGYTGGIIGELTSCHLFNATVAGDVTGASYVGGCVGRANTPTKFSLVYVSSTVKGSDNVGGIVGNLIACDTISNCHFHGSVTGKAQIGGLCGSYEYQPYGGTVTGTTVGTTGYIGELSAATLKQYGIVAVLDSTTSSSIYYVDGEASNAKLKYKIYNNWGSELLSTTRYRYVTDLRPDLSLTIKDNTIDAKLQSDSLCGGIIGTITREEISYMYGMKSSLSYTTSYGTNYYNYSSFAS
jgi:hypothetical protein